MTPSKPTIIGIGHRARQGKLTVAKAIHCAMPAQSWIFSFADALKAHCRVNLGMTVKDSALLQKEGCRFRETVHPDFWFKILWHSIAEFAPDYGAHLILIQDVRFPNEAEWIKSMGGYLIKVVRHNADGSPFVAPDRDPHHISETALDRFTDWDAVVRAGSGCLDSLRERGLKAFYEIARRARK